MQLMTAHRSSILNFMISVQHLLLVQSLLTISQLKSADQAGSLTVQREKEIHYVHSASLAYEDGKDDQESATLDQAICIHLEHLQLPEQDLAGCGGCSLTGMRSRVCASPRRRDISICPWQLEIPKTILLTMSKQGGKDHNASVTKVKAHAQNLSKSCTMI